MTRPDHHDLNVQDMKPWKRMGCDGEIDDMLRIRLHEAGSDEEIFTSVAWIRAFNINEPIYTELCHEFYSTYEFDEVCADDELQTKKIIKFRLGGHAHGLTLLEFTRRVLIEDVVRSLSALIYCRDLDSTTLRDLIDSDDTPRGDREDEYRQSYHWDRYQGVFEHMARVYSVPMQGAYNPPGYAQPQYDQYYQQYPPTPPQYQQQDDDE
ncbi:hypothetical protein Tco_0690310 [Tanacetum coccineum]